MQLWNDITVMQGLQKGNLWQFVHGRHRDVWLAVYTSPLGNSAQDHYDSPISMAACVL